jgi:hypothetical protein
MQPQHHTFASQALHHMSVISCFLETILLDTLLQPLSPHLLAQHHALPATCAAITTPSKLQGGRSSTMRQSFPTAIMLSVRAFSPPKSIRMPHRATPPHRPKNTINMVVHAQLPVAQRERVAYIVTGYDKVRAIILRYFGKIWNAAAA